MFKRFAENKSNLTGGIVTACLLGGLCFLPNFTSQADPEAPPPFIAASNDELLDQIFEEEKSNRVCRFIKNRKMKA